MRTAITALALAGLTTAAHAQNVGTVTLTTSATVISVGDVFTIGVVPTDSIDGGSIFQFDIGVTGVGAAFSTVPDSLLADPGETGFIFGMIGELTTTTAWGYGGSSDILGPSLEAPLDGVTVFRFQAIATEPGTIEFTSADGSDLTPSYDSIGYAAPCIVLCPMPYDIVLHEGVTITVIPTPSSLLPLALAFPLTARRRR